jgi:hypothetical protein
MKQLNTNRNMGAGQRLAQYGDPQSNAFKRWFALRQYTLDDVADGLERLATALLRRPGQIGLTGGGYAYYPTNRALTRWVASDGSELEVDLLSIALEYAGTVHDTPLDAACGSDVLDDVLIDQRVGQDDYEAGRMCGDWR